MEHDNNQNMPVAFTVTNEMLYELLKDFKTDVNRRFEEVTELIREEGRQRDKLETKMELGFRQVDERFKQTDERFEKMEQRLEQRFEKIEERFEKIEAKLDEIYESRKSMSVRFTTKWAFASFSMAVLSSTIVLAFDKAF